MRHDIPRSPGILIRWLVALFLFGLGMTLAWALVHLLHVSWDRGLLVAILFVVCLVGVDSAMRGD